jgi:hypothetical protein
MSILQSYGRHMYQFLDELKVIGEAMKDIPNLKQMNDVIRVYHNENVSSAFLRYKKCNWLSIVFYISDIEYGFCFICWLWEYCFCCLYILFA